MTENAIEGGCLCGAVRYRATGAPTNSMVCHCDSCRKAAGAPVVAWVTVPSESFAFTKGEPRSYRSSAPVTRTFCATCGTPLTYHHDARPQEVDMTTGSLDVPAGFAPTWHGWTEDAIAWVRFGDGLPQYKTTRSAG